MTDLDYTELTDFAKDLMELAIAKYPKERDKFLRREGNKLKAQVKVEFKQTTKKRTGNLLRGITRGKPYTWEGDTRAVRVYPTKPAYHAHLVEKGHRIVPHHGPRKKTGKKKKLEKYTGRKNRHGSYAKGVHAMEYAEDAFQERFETDCSDWVDEMLEEGLL